MFSVYNSVIVSPCACDLFVSKVTKITRYMDVHFWRSFFCAFQCVMTVSWNQPQPGCWNYLYYILIHSCTYTTQHFKQKRFLTMFYFQLKCITLCMRTFWHQVIYGSLISRGNLQELTSWESQEMGKWTDKQFILFD